MKKNLLIVWCWMAAISYFIPAHLFYGATNTAYFLKKYCDKHSSYIKYLIDQLTILKTKQHE